VVKGQITKANEKQWAEMNTTLRPYLEVEGVDINGKPAPMPERQVLEPPIASLSEAAAQEIDDMKATAGIFDASLGAKSNEQSGQAILKTPAAVKCDQHALPGQPGACIQKGWADYC
jgi:hypothetical protein